MLPALHMIEARKGDGVVKADIYADFASDCMFLVVKHVLFTRREMEEKDYRLIGPRMERALLTTPNETPRWLRGERRRLHSRGAEASARKPKKARK